MTIVAKQRWSRRGIILPTILLMLILIGLLAASLSFHINARLESTRTSIRGLQTRLAAESCIEKVKLILRDDRMNMNRWYNNPDELHRMIIWKSGGDESVWDTNEEFEDESMVYRCSVVADDFTDDEEFIRIGITDEASKLNINVATREQLMILVSAATAERDEIDAGELVGAILDWRDADSDAQTQEGDTEGKYYDQLIRPYRVKNGPLDTIEELLLVKGMDGRIMYGEDYDRNGLLTPNEDDGDERFPPDDGDGFLNLGLLPYITVHSRDINVSNDQRDRIALYNNPRLAKQLEEEFDDRRKVQFIQAAVSAGQNSGNGGGGRGNRRRDRNSGTSGSTGGEIPMTGSSGTSAIGADGLPITARDDPKRNRLAQERNPQGGTSGTSGTSGGGFRENEALDDSAGMGDGSGGSATGAGGTTTDGTPLGGSPLDDSPLDGTTTDGTAAGAAGANAGGDGSNSQPMTTPAQLLLDSGGERSPFGVEDLPILMDRLTVNQPRMESPGLININTAPFLVLKCIQGLSEEQIAGILATRDALDSEVKATTAWLVTEDVLSLEKFIEIAPLITARGTQFTIEALGYADFMGMVTRLQVVVEMRGPLVQAVYHRDLTHLGGHYPIREDDLEAIRGQR